MGLQREPTTPLYLQLKESLKSEIRAGRYTPDNRLPSERDLCKRYKVSRITVRQAMAELIRDGLIFSQIGKGTFVSEPKIHTGLENLLHERVDLLTGKRVGLVSHPAAVLPNLTGIYPALQGMGVRVIALFGPEHGFRGAAADGAQVGDSTDHRNGAPVYSLYGSSLEPTPEMLAGVDVLVFDLQDVGVRFYTYLSTLYYVLRGAAHAGKPVIVLDRPNPITGTLLEGPSIDPGFESFVGIIPVPIRHGLTIGELARYINGEFNLGASLTVIPMQGWQRINWFDDTGLPWVPTSPAMPHLSTAIVYPGMCLIEGCNLSTGRGTALPFEICGAPWIDGEILANKLNALDLPGARFRPVVFLPHADRFAGEECGGVQVHVTSREVLRPVTLGLHLLAALRAMAPGRFRWNRHFDLLTGGEGVRQALEQGVSVAEIVAAWAPELVRFDQQRRPYFLYA